MKAPVVVLLILRSFTENLQVFICHWNGLGIIARGVECSQDF